MAPKVFKSAISIFFEYDTQKIVHIRSKKVGIINRFIQLVIIGYIVGYVIVYEKGYQEFDNVQSAVTSKVKGIVFSNFSKESGIGTRTWDVADYVIPPQESNAFFVMTNVIVTPKQSQNYCDEDPSVHDIHCTDDSDCESRKGEILPGGNGPLSGKCVNSTFPGQEDIKVCQIYGWCPVERDVMHSTTPVLQGSRNFTVFIKNNIEFPHFNVKRRNLPEKKGNDYLKNCTYNSESSEDKFCPIFRLNAIIEGAGFKYENISQEGGVMQIVIDWTCNLDYSVDNCVPDYSFRRLDRGDFTIAKGFNFRYADKYMENDTMYRTLYKAYGIRFLISVQGRAGKFSIIPLLLNIGSGMALLGIATLISDIVVLYILKARHFYRDKKYLDVKGQDAFEILDEDSDPSQMEDDNVKRRNTNNSES